MSVMGYFERRRNEIRMPKGPDQLGIRWEGPVLSGEVGLELQQKLEAGREAQRLGERCKRPEEYDPVLRAHCGMGEE